MTARTVGPASVTGTVGAPPSKSYTHRALVLAFLSDEGGRVHNPLVCADTRATRAGLAALGRTVQSEGDSWVVDPPGPVRASRRAVRIDCGQSGTTLRFLTAVAATRSREVILTGDRQLARRPMGPLLDFLERAGARIRRPAGRWSIPLSVEGPIHPIEADVDISESSQFLSALLLALPALAGESRLRVRGVPVSRPYVDATLDMLVRSGIRIRVSPGEYLVRGPQNYRAADLDVPGDASSAAYLWAAGAVAGGPVRVTNIAPGRPQADLAILEVLERMGADVERTADGAVTSGRALRATRVDLTDAPDLYPLVGALASTAVGTSVISGAPHAVRKESDRRAATVALVRRIGGTARRVETGIEVTGTRIGRPLAVDRIDDHRVVMSAAIAALAASGPSLIGDATTVAKSYPGFWSALSSIGAPSRRVRR